ncbi:hypothetical protein ABT247_08205 [Kitasatospora sp. NPDC001539]|uniref:hypothetical protein n=1 Tax=Kitasatospora sp. NPDC001539 TaxID=3154384 RepID=UPI00332B99D3
MKPRKDTSAPAPEPGRDRFRELPERIRPESTFVSVPTSTVDPGQGGFSHDDWLTRNTWCGSLI